MTNDLHEANRLLWEATSPRWAQGADSRGLWRRCSAEPRLVLCDRELAHLGVVTGKRVCILGSGDNQVAFALAGMGAEVTSVDISQAQLNAASDRAQQLGLTLTFVPADVVDLSELANESFDVVYTGGHVAVWVSNLERYYAEAVRILRQGGLFLISEYHPFRRLWRESKDRLEIEYPYFERGPFEYDVTADVLRPEPGPFKSYEFHWTVSDFMNAVIEAGCSIEEIHEFGTEVADWEAAPMHGIPEFLMIAALKDMKEQQ